MNLSPCEQLLFTYRNSKLTIRYLFCKLLQLISAGFQYIMLSLCFGSYVWGPVVLSKLFSGIPLPANNIFPYLTLCKFSVRKISKLETYYAQCVLMINMFNEKIFLFLWFWLVLMAVTNLCSFIHWFLLISGASRKRVMYSFLKKTQLNIMRNEPVLNCFVKFVLTPDMLLVLAFISANYGEILCRQLVVQMYQEYEKESLL